jgi:hypothetical protein
MTQPSTTTLPDHYATLQVSETASSEVITAAYRSLARKYHPDTNPSPEANAKMKAINVAYDVLSDRNKRAAYDRQRIASAKAVTPSAKPPQPAKSPPPAPQPGHKPQPTAAPRTPPPPPTKPQANHPPPTAAPKAAPAPSLVGSIGSMLASPAFTTFVITFIVVFAALTIVAELLMQYEYEWLIIPIALLAAVGVAWARSRRNVR